jgi:hypothetical protein
MSRLFILAFATLVALPVIAEAQTTDATRADRRQVRQEQRIDQGVQSGQLNQREAARLERGQNRVGAMETRAQSDGSVSKREKARIERTQDAQSKRILRQKNDRQAPARRGAG